jgi:hypothetical protein
MRENLMVTIVATPDQAKLMTKTNNEIHRDLDKGGRP